MNPKERQHLGDIHARIVAGSFSESDTSALLSLVRWQTGDGPLRELSHNIAHSERDKGLFYKRIVDNKTTLDNINNAAGTIDAREVFAVARFEKELNKVLVAQKLAALTTEQTELVLLCIMSLIQGTTFERKRIAELSLIATAASIILVSTIETKKGAKVRCDILSVPNRWIPIGNPRCYLDPVDVVTVRVENHAAAITGFKPFECYIERLTPISEEDLVALANASPQIQRVDVGTVRITDPELHSVDLRWNGTRLSFVGRPEYLRGDSQLSGLIRAAATTLGACVHDDGRAHWFLDPKKLGESPDEFDCWFIGHAGAHCTHHFKMKKA